MATKQKRRCGNGHWRISTCFIYDNFRYRMLPYIYSEAWQVTEGNDTMMRPLVMDFRD